MKRVLCAWSGGLDSTRMVYDYLRSGYEVDCFYINITNNAEKVKREAQAKNKLLKKLQAFGSIRYRTPSVFTMWGTSNAGLCLPPLLLTAAADYDTGEYEEVAFGYVMGDDAISFLPEISKLWKSLQKLRFGSKAKITFPLKQKSKLEVYYGLPYELFEDVTWCESQTKTTKRNCGNCTPCKKMNFYGIHTEVTTNGE